MEVGGEMDGESRKAGVAARPSERRSPQRLGRSKMPAFTLVLVFMMSSVLDPVDSGAEVQCNARAKVGRDGKVLE